MKTIGVICYNSDDFDRYMNYYLKDINVINRSRTTRRIEKTLYISIYNLLGFTGITYHYYIFTENAHKNKKIIDILKHTAVSSYHNCR